MFFCTTFTVMDQDVRPHCLSTTPAGLHSSLAVSSAASTATTALGTGAFAQEITEFRIGILGGENAQDRMNSNECMRAMTEDALGVPTKLFAPADYNGVIQGLLGGTLDMAWLGASAYAAVYLQDAEAVEPVLVKINVDGSYGYHSIGFARADSGITNLEEYVAAVKEAGKDWKMGGTGTGAEDSLVTAMLEKEFGLSMTYVPFEGGGDVAKNLVGGHVNSTVNNPSEQMGFYNAGKSVPIAAFTPERIEAFPDVPTMTELGHDLVYAMQRSFVAPPDMPEEAVAYYTEMFSKLNELPEWQKYTADEALDRDFLTGDELQQYFLTEREKHAELLSAMGESS